MKTLFYLVIFSVLVGPLAVSAKNRQPEKGVQCRGIIVDADGQMPLAYVSIGVLNKPAGTVADSLGRFQLVIGNQYRNDTLQVSMVGYYPVQQPIRELAKDTGAITIVLHKKLIQLNEVAVSNQFKHTEIIGRQSSGHFIQAALLPKGDKAPTIGAETGLRIRARRYPALLDNFNFYLSANNFKFIKFRLNIYSLRNNLPDTLLFNKEILVSLSNYKTGWTQIDLSPYDMVINRDCAVSLQWVDYNKDMVESPQILVPAGVSFSQVSYFRITSQDKWKSVKGNFSVFMTLED